MASPPDIARQRLASQRLLEPTATTARAVVARLGAVQSQDYPGARWALGLRTASLTDANVEKECDSGAIVRTHVLRPTWHFVAAADIRWMLALTGPRLIAGNARRSRELALDEAVYRRSNAVLVKALRDGRALTRAEAAAVLARAGIETTTPQRFVYLIMRAELEGIVCSGPRRGTQQTYALLDERVPPARPRDRDDALGELALRYFPARGPATPHDFSWWSGLTVSDARRAIAAAGRALEQRTMGGTVYWLGAGTAPAVRARRPDVLLLPNYDEYFIGFRDRSAILAVVRRSDPARTVAITAHVIVVDGQVVGGWTRALKRGRVVVALDLLRPLTPAERRALAATVERYGAFLELPAALA